MIKSMMSFPWGLLTIVIALLTLFLGASPPVELSNEVSHLSWLAPAILLVPFVVFGSYLPHVKAGFMAVFWQVPKNTYLIARPLLKLAAAHLVGTAIGMTILVGIKGQPYFPILVLVLPTAIAFLYSCSLRFRKNPKSEFVMSFFDYLRKQDRIVNR